MQSLAKPLQRASAGGIIRLALALALTLPAVQLCAQTASDVQPAEEHDLYDPARTALVNARRHLAETFKKEQEIIEQQQRIDQELAASLALLEDAQKHDPEMKAPIADLRKRIRALQQDDPESETTALEALGDTYDRLLADFEALIAHY